MACESPASAPKTLQICVPGGTFEMGGRTFDPCARLRTGFAACTAAESSEGVWHSVFQTPFGLDRTEVTNLHYRDCVEAGRCSRPQSASVGDAASGSGVYRNYTRSPLYDDYPVVYVSHAQAVDYCGFRGGRLPTEAEWEVAVSGSSEAYSWGDAPTPVTACQADAEAVAFGSCTHGLPFPVGRAKLDRRADVVDLMGNVSEWVLDAWDPLAYCDETSKALYRPPLWSRRPACPPSRTPTRSRPSGPGKAAASKPATPSDSAAWPPAASAKTPLTTPSRAARSGRTVNRLVRSPEAATAPIKTTPRERAVLRPAPAPRRALSRTSRPRRTPSPVTAPASSPPRPAAARAAVSSPSAGPPVATCSASRTACVASGVKPMARRLRCLWSSLERRGWRKTMSSREQTI